MSKVRIIERLNRLEKEVKMLKSLFPPKVDFSIDEKNWKKIKKELKKSRAQIFKKVYGR